MIESRLANNRLKLSFRHRPCMRKARASVPAAYRRRWAVWDNDLNESEPDRTLLVGPD